MKRTLEKLLQRLATEAGGALTDLAGAPEAEAAPALEEAELHLRDAVASLRRARLAIGEAKTAVPLERCR